MENQETSTKKPNLWQRFKSRTILFNLVIIVMLFGFILIGLFYAMSIGTRHNARRTVPNFVGMMLNEAEQTATQEDLVIVVNDSLYVSSYPGGAVLDQLPKDGVVVKPGRKIYITVNSFRQRMVEVPYVTGYSLRQAKNMLETAGLSIERIEYSHDLATNNVIAEYVGEKKVLENSNMQAEKGSGVILRVGVSSSARPLVAPILIGRSLHEAKSRLWETGLNVGEVVYDEGIMAIDRSHAKVYAQSVAPGHGIRYGGSVSLHLTLDNEKVALALSGYDIKALEAKLEADSIAHAQQQHYLDSLANLETQQLFEGTPMPDSLSMEILPDSLP